MQRAQQHRTGDYGYVSHKKSGRTSANGQPEEQNSELQGNSVNFQDQDLTKNQSMALLQLVKKGAQTSVQKSNA